MIVTLAIYVIALLFAILGLILPDFQLWPTPVLDSINLFVTKLLELNSIFFVVPVILQALSFFLKFIIYFFIYKIAIKAMNYLRGAGSGLD